ncbi:ABC-three component system protein [Streptomonospora litoralis]|uniref:Uncharacterized protein n=1 Tax=Streptomonospora litoralis TaxID=2498135 RepID=A0A4P6QAY1_9ACTN|nr:ABC-three component system protein [Streptomonospora litoralis]QBI56497.1 hypothetical protein EKD16_23755 [Streptomonospora litoralis]
MLRELGAGDERFRTVRFTEGLNLLIADRTAASTEQESRNAVGKTSAAELLQFLLGADQTKLTRNSSIKSMGFHLDLDWPGIGDTLRVRRSGAKPGYVFLTPDITGTSAVDPTLFRVDRAGTTVPISDWRSELERSLFGIRAEDSGLSGRTLISFYIRRAEAGGFSDALRPNTKVSRHVATANLCYLLGMDWALAKRYNDVSEKDQTRKKLAGAAKDNPTLGKIVGSSAKLRGRIQAVDERISGLERQIEGFQVVPEYEEIRREADQVDARIRELRSSEVVDRRNLEDMERAVTEATEPDDAYLEGAYSELGVVLGREVRARFDQVKEFHQAVVRNRRHYLDEEIDRLRRQLQESERERGRLGDRQAELLRILHDGGALDTLTMMQRVLAKEVAEREALQHRAEAAEALEQSRREITQEKLQLEGDMAADIAERRKLVQQASSLFTRFARRLYGNDRNPYLNFEAKRSSLDIVLQLDSDSSSGISNMKTFCFDLTWAVVAHRAGRGPDFLVHDSKIYDGVDERQVKEALSLAAEVMAEEGMQYIVTINSDDLDKAVRLGFDPAPYEIAPRLNDRPEGGLFGFRF